MKPVNESSVKFFFTLFSAMIHDVWKLSVKYRTNFLLGTFRLVVNYAMELDFDSILTRIHFIILFCFCIH